MSDVLAKRRFFPSDNGRSGAAPFRSLLQASQYATLLPAVYPSASLFSSDTEQLLQEGNSHLKHLYLLFMKQEQRYFHHVVRCQQRLSIACNSRRSRPQRPRSFWSAPKGGRRVAKLSLYSACSSGGGGKNRNSVWQIEKYVFLWRLPSPSHLNQFCNLHDLWIEFSACLERRLLKRRTRSNQFRIIRLGKSKLCMLESNQRIWIGLNCSKRRTIHIRLIQFDQYSPFALGLRSS